MRSITMKDFIDKYICENNNVDRVQFKDSLVKAVESKKNGAVCMHCNNPIWAVGTSICGWNGCFTCITGKADGSEDYEIDIVNFK